MIPGEHTATSALDVGHSHSLPGGDVSVQENAQHEDSQTLGSVRREIQIGVTDCKMSAAHRRYSPLRGKWNSRKELLGAHPSLRGMDMLCGVTSRASAIPLRSRAVLCS